jgi:hypothetical protein
LYCLCKCFIFIATWYLTLSRKIWNIYGNKLLSVWWVCLGRYRDPGWFFISPCFRSGVREWSTVGTGTALILAFETS